jgi:hypothetical protein
VSHVEIITTSCQEIKRATRPGKRNKTDREKKGDFDSAKEQGQGIEFEVKVKQSQGKKMIDTC